MQGVRLGLERLVARVEFRLQRLQLLRGHRLVRGGLLRTHRKQGGIKNKVGVQRDALARVRAGQPVQKVEEFLGRLLGIARLDRTAAMHGLVAQVFDDARFHEHFLRHKLAKRWLVDQGRKRVVIRQGKRGIVRVQPVGRQFQRPPGVEAGGARIGQGEGFHAPGGGIEFRPFGF